MVVIISLSFFIGSTHEVLTYKDPQFSVSSFPEVAVSAESFEIFDIETGTELASKNSHQPMPIASVTKLITASALLDQEGIDTHHTLTADDIEGNGRAGKLGVGEDYSSRELLLPLLLESSNDAGGALHRLHPNILNTMNAYAQSLGLTQTEFSDTTGLSPNNTATGHELSILLKFLFETKRYLFDLTTLSETYGAHTGWKNNNPVSLLPGFKGGKHGFTEASGRTLVAVFGETLGGGKSRDIGYVLLKSNNLKADIELLRKEVVKNVEFK